jgi:hypothetical protein
MMFVTLVAVLCHVSPGPSGVCVEEIVTDSSKNDISFQSCMIQGQSGVTKWMSEHPIYRADTYFLKTYYLKTYYLKTSQTV